MKIKFHSNTYPSSVYPSGYFRITLVEVLDHKGKLWTEGLTKQHPNDNDCRVLGQKNALRNALQALPRSQRSIVWDEFKSHSKKTRKLTGGE